MDSVKCKVLSLNTVTANSLQFLEFEFNGFEPRLKFEENWFQLSASLNLETLNAISSGTNHIWAAAQI